MTDILRLNQVNDYPSDFMSRFGEVLGRYYEDGSSMPTVFLAESVAPENSTCLLDISGMLYVMFPERVRFCI